ncbi:MAG: hypothetical protein PHF84_00665 [bacterium]|nr:hypothetical protein [bacterium]
MNLAYGILVLLVSHVLFLFRNKEVIVLLFSVDTLVLSLLLPLFFRFILVLLFVVYLLSHLRTGFPVLKNHGFFFLVLLLGSCYFYAYYFFIIHFPYLVHRTMPPDKLAVFPCLILFFAGWLVAYEKYFKKP